MTPNLPAAQLTTALRGHDAAGEVVVFHPETGEGIVLSRATIEQLAEWRQACDAWVESAKSARRLVDAEIVSRMDKQASWTIQTTAGKLVSVSGSSTEYKDVDQLRYDLLVMADEGKVERGVVDAALELVPETVKPDKAALARLAKLQNDVGERVRAAQVPVTRDSRGVRLTAR